MAIVAVAGVEEEGVDVGEEEVVVKMLQGDLWMEGGERGAEMPLAVQCSFMHSQRDQILTWRMVKSSSLKAPVQLSHLPTFQRLRVLILIPGQIQMVTLVLIWILWLMLFRPNFL